MFLRVLYVSWAAFSVLTQLLDMIEDLGLDTALLLVIEFFNRLISTVILIESKIQSLNRLSI